MGLLRDGQWVDEWYVSDQDGSFVRQESRFRDFVGEGRFAPEKDRYHLYVSYACPWAHRTLIFRNLKGLTNAIGVSVVHPDMFDKGWTFDASDEKVVKDPVGDAAFLYEVYLRADKNMSGRVTVPVLWDKTENTIVNNESSEIIRMLNGPFSALSDNEDRARIDFNPESHRAEIDRWNDLIYPAVNNGVYRCGFATSQSAYAKAFDSLFAALDKIDTHLAAHRYLAGDVVTEADWRLFTTLVRFDAVYFGHFKCNERRIVDYAHLSGYLRELYQWPGVSQTVHMDHIKGHYYRSHTTINPTRIVPEGPALDFDAPHGRDALPRAGDGVCRHA